MKSKIVLALVAAGFLFPGTSMSAQECSRDESYAAEIVVDYLLSWESVYRFYNEFGHCFDGAIAEGASDRIHELWANKWAELHAMLALTRKDEGFREFLRGLLESEDFPHDTFAKIVQSARTRCPKDGSEFCRAVLEAEAVRTTRANSK